MLVNKIIRVSTVPISLNILLKNQFIFLSKHFDVTALSSGGKDLMELQNREKVNIKAIEMKREISIFNDLFALVRLYVYFKNEKPMIVHSITPKAGLLSMIAAKLAGVPIRMHTFTGLIFPTKNGMMKKLLIKMDKLVCYCATNVYPEGSGVKKDLLNYNITRKPLKLLANGNVNGVDLEYFDSSHFSVRDREQLKKQLSVNCGDFIFIFVGRLVKDKGINELVESFNNLQNPSCKLLLVGSYEQDRDPLLAKTLHIISTNKNIISVGFQPDVRGFLAISDVLVFPSYREGFPNILLQSGAMQLPSIVTDVNGSNEIIINNENGIIIPVKNVLVLQNSMNKICRDHAFRNKLKNNARKLISDRFQQKIVLEALLEEYKNLENNV